MFNEREVRLNSGDALIKQCVGGVVSAALARGNSE
jgi:hypothetical protein